MKRKALRGSEGARASTRKRACWCDLRREGRTEKERERGECEWREDTVEEERNAKERKTDQRAFDVVWC